MDAIDWIISRSSFKINSDLEGVCVGIFALNLRLLLAHDFCDDAINSMFPKLITYINPYINA